MEGLKVMGVGGQRGKKTIAHKSAENKVIILKIRL